MPVKEFSPDVEWWDIGKVIPYALNAKNHPEQQVAKIAASIAEFGFDQPIVVDPDGVIIKGHGRWEACQKLGIATVPVIVRADLSRAQVKAARIADNKVAESDYDMDALGAELQQLDELGFDLTLTGLSEMEIDAFLGEPVEGDPEQTWDGMPEFQNEDQQSAHKVVVHFANMDDFEDFKKLVGQDINEKRKFIWYPEVKYGVYRDQEYVAAATADEP
jgi:hypothetical protein